MYGDREISRSKNPDTMLHEYTKPVVQWYYMEHIKWLKFDEHTNSRINDLLNGGHHKGNIGSLRINFSDETVTDTEGKTSYIAHHVISKPVLWWYFLTQTKWIRFNLVTNSAINTMVENGRWKGQIGTLYFNFIDGTVKNKYDQVAFIAHETKHVVNPSRTDTTMTTTENNSTKSRVSIDKHAQIKTISISRGRKYSTPTRQFCYLFQTERTKKPSETSTSFHRF